MSIKFSDKVPIYIQITNIVKRDIVLGKLKPGDKLPSVREMSAELQVNPNTLQRAYQELERENITYTQRGTGSFVKEDIVIMKNLKNEMAEETIEEFIKGMRNLGFTGEEIITFVKEKVKEE